MDKEKSKSAMVRISERELKFLLKANEGARLQLDGVPNLVMGEEFKAAILAQLDALDAKWKAAQGRLK